MSHNMKMYVCNHTSHTIKSFSVTHSWDSHTKTLDGINLATKEKSAPVEIETGYGPQKDWYTIEVEIDNIGAKSTDFYCNSSHDHNSVMIAFHDDFVNCNYYTQEKPWDHNIDTACSNKSYR